MTALAKLVAYWRKRAPDLVPYTVAADQLEAALSPADLGGAIGYVSQSSLDALIACRNDAHNGYAEVWMRQTDTFTVPVYTTPRAAEADWLPIESAPKDGTEIWLGAPNIMRVAFWYSPVDLWIDFSAAEADERGLPMSMLGVSFVPTHWHQLPHRIPEPCSGFVCNGAPG